MKSATVVIPTIGKSTLEQAILSVKEQDYENVHPYVFVDGEIYFGRSQYVMDVIYSLFDDTHYTKMTVLADNVGAANGQSFYGHRIYAASPHLVNTDYVLFLDEDNWYKRNHVSSLIELCERKELDFAFSHRGIYSEKGEFEVKDSCESLGMWPIYGDERNGYLVDTSSYCFRREYLIQVAHHWHFGWGADRRFFNIVKNQYLTTKENVVRPVRYGTTGDDTLCYRLNGNSNSVGLDFFWKGRDRTPSNCKGEKTNVP